MLAKRVVVLFQYCLQNEGNKNLCGENSEDLATGIQVTQKSFEKVDFELNLTDIYNVR